MLLCIKQKIRAVALEALFKFLIGNGIEESKNSKAF